MVAVNAELDGSPGGFVEAVKRTVVVSLRRVLTDSSLSLSDSTLHVDMEYPDERESYPAIWVQFSFTDLEDCGLGHVQYIQEDDGTTTRVRQWRYKGRVSLTMLAFTSLDRDRIADRFVTLYSFADIVASEDDPFTDPNMDFLRELDQSPYVSMTLQSGTLQPLGQGVSVGVPWDPSQLVYEDGYAFSLEGQFQQTYNPKYGYRLSRIDIHPTHSLFDTIQPGDWT